MPTFSGIVNCGNQGQRDEKNVIIMSLKHKRQCENRKYQGECEMEKCVIQYYTMPIFTQITLYQVISYYCYI